MGNHANSLSMSQARHIATIEKLEDVSFEFDSSVDGLIEKAPRKNRLVAFAVRVQSSLDGG